MSPTESTMAMEYNLNQVLQVLRHSDLHFSAQETPYSMYISIRKKMRKHEANPPPLSYGPEEICDLKRQCKSLENALEAVKNELSQEIDAHEETMEEKNNLDRRLTSSEELNDNIKNKNEELKVEVRDLDSNLKLMKKNMKTKEKELYDFKKENETFRENLEGAKSDLKRLSVQVKKYEKDGIKKSKVKQSKDTQNNMEFPCDICPNKYESPVQLRVHVKLDHCTTNSSQTEEIFLESKSVQTREDIQIGNANQTFVTADFEIYSCFYCHKELVCEQDMNQHRLRCHGASDFPSLFSLPVRCPPPAT